MLKTLLCLACAMVLVAGCRTKHDVAMTHDVKPIEITLNINLKIDKELDDFFGDIDEAAASDLAADDNTVEEE